MNCGFFSANVSLFSFCPDDLSIGNSVVLNLLTITVLGLICIFTPYSISFMKLGAHVFGVYIFITIISS